MPERKCELQKPEQWEAIWKHWFPILVWYTAQCRCLDSHELIRTPLEQTLCFLPHSHTSLTRVKPSWPVSTVSPEMQTSVFMQLVQFCLTSLQPTAPERQEQTRRTSVAVNEPFYCNWKFTENKLSSSSSCPVVILINNNTSTTVCLSQWQWVLETLSLLSEQESHPRRPAQITICSSQEKA